ncbi:MAG: hypothetical protein QHC67_01250 [Sphingobium sp.]|uniref:hypothetical protein n=1 Tax=Sphingobium sp. TaxID=1912891 RepID=UPI0029B3EA12|nr:hypothetical protein [Sphingobium sp.]MDX3908434.1 hypothetical protein [Sphingobium sp.]
MTMVQTTGYYAPGDGGGASYEPVASQPAHPGKFQDASGRWFEIIGPVFNVRAFGAKGDCPDVSAMTPVNQTAIRAAVTAATNDIAAFRSALIVCKYKGGGIVEYSDGIFRIAFSAAIPGLGTPSNVEWRPVGDARLEFDPTLLADINTYPGAGAARAWLENEIGAGDPETCTRFLPRAASKDACIVSPGGATLADFVHDITFEKVRIYAHIRTYWKALPSPAQRWRMFGIRTQYAYNIKFNDCFVHGTPNDGLSHVGGWNIEYVSPKTSLVGYGGQKSATANGISAYGIMFRGSPALSSRDIRVDAPTTHFTKDEGVAVGGCARGVFVNNHSSFGDHDRAVEGPFPTLDTAAIYGEEIPNQVTIDSVELDGIHEVGTGSITVGTNQLLMPDAFYVHPNDEENKRVVYVAGSGAGGVDAFYTIEATDYVNNIVTLGTNALTTVAGARVYVKSMGLVSLNNANEGDYRVTGLRGRDMHCLYPPVDITQRSGGTATVDDIIIRDSYLPAGADGIRLAVKEATTGDSISFINVTGGSGASAVRVGNAGAGLPGAQLDTARIGNFYFDGSGFDHYVNVGSLAAAKELSIGEVRSTLTSTVNAAAVHISHKAYCGRVSVKNGKMHGFNSIASATNGYVFFSAGNLASFGEIDIGLNEGTPTNPPYCPITANPAFPAGAIGQIKVQQNDWGDGYQFLDPAINFTTIFPGSFGTAISGGVSGALIDANNNVPGQRVRTSAAVPTTGTFGQGDRVRNTAPTAGGTLEWVCVTPGTFGALPSGTPTVTTVNNQRDATITDTTGIKPGTYLTITGIGVLRVAKVLSPTSVRFSTNAGITATAAAVANRPPVFKAVTGVAP